MITFYELLSLFPGSVTDEEVQTIKESLRERLEKHGAKVTKHEIWERRKLAYPIGQVRQGVYLLSEFDLDSVLLNTIDQELTHDKSILRHQIVRGHRKTAEELAREVRHLEEHDRQAKEVKTEPEREISKEELEEKLAEILTDDMVQ